MDGVAVVTGAAHLLYFSSDHHGAQLFEKLLLLFAAVYGVIGYHVGAFQLLVGASLGYQRWSFCLHIILFHLFCFVVGVYQMENWGTTFFGQNAAGAGGRYGTVWA